MRLRVVFNEKGNILAAAPLNLLGPSESGEWPTSERVSARPTLMCLLSMETMTCWPFSEG